MLLVSFLRLFYTSILDKTQVLLLHTVVKRNVAIFVIILKFYRIYYLLKLYNNNNNHEI